MFAVGQEPGVGIDVSDELVELGSGVGESAGDIYSERFVVIGEEGGQEGSLCCCLVEGSGAE